MRFDVGAPCVVPGPAGSGQLRIGFDPARHLRGRTLLRQRGRRSQHQRAAGHGHVLIVDVALQVLVEHRGRHIGAFTEVLFVGQVERGGTPRIQQRVAATGEAVAQTVVLIRTIGRIHLQRGTQLVDARASDLLLALDARLTPARNL